MKTNHFTFIFAVLMVAAGCILSCSRGGKQTVEKQAVVIDTTIPLRTDSVNPEWNAKLDSLLRMAATAQQDTNLAKLYYNIGDMYEDNVLEKAKEYYLKCNDLSERLDWDAGRWMFADDFSVLLAREGLTDSALVILSSALESAKKQNNEKWFAVLSVAIGQVYMMKDWHETALSYFMETLPIFERTNDAQILGSLYENMGKVYRQLKLVEKAIEYDEKAIAILGDDPFALTGLATTYSDDQQYEKSNKYYEKALHICMQQNNKYLMEYIYFQLASNALSIYDLERVEMYLNKMLETGGSEDNMSFHHPYLLVRGGLERLRGNFAQSEKYILQSLEIANKQDLLEAKRLGYLVMAELSLAQHKYRENTQYIEKLDKVEKDIARGTATRAAAEMQAKYETEKKNLEIERQQNIIKRQNLQRGLLAGGVVVSIVILALLWYMLRLRNRRNHALAEMNATKDKFFSIISHDLKNPAVAQRDALLLLIKNTGLWDVPTLANYYEGLLETAEGQVELVYNLLNWAQIQTGRMTYTPADFNLFARLRSDISMIHKMAENKGIIFVVEIPEDAIVTGDSNMLAIVVRNLLTNAVKFTPAGGTVSLDASCDKGACPLAYTISVTDNGTGMSEEQIRNLFQLENKYSRRGTADEQGSGLGLIVCKELLEKHGSELHVESEEGKGSRFWFTISSLEENDHL